MTNLNKIDEIIVVDLECTCCDDDSFPREEMEIIEIGAAIYQADNFQLIDKFSELVLPKKHLILTKFCTNLTGITQKELEEKGEKFELVIEQLQEWIDFTEGNRCWGSWGAFDFYKMKSNCHQNRVFNPFEFLEHINLKEEFSKKIGKRKGYGLRRALSIGGFEFEGIPHRALPDTLNTGRLLPLIFSKEKYEQ